MKDVVKGLNDSQRGAFLSSGIFIFLSF